jgi:hypothetical protein
VPGDWSTVAAAAVGATAGISGGALLEMYKRRRDRRGTAYALAGAIHASVREVQQFKVVEHLTSMVANLDKEPDAVFAAAKLFTDAPVKYNLTVFEKHTDRLGLISPQLSERTILWFSSYAGFQHVLWRMLAKCETNKQAASVIRNLDDNWKEVGGQAPKLAADLMRSARWYRWF